MKKIIAFVLLTVLTISLSAQFTVNFEKPSNWNAVYVYSWGGSLGDNAFGDWPGVEMTAGTEDWYSYTAPAAGDGNLIFTNNEGLQTIAILTSVDACYTLSGDTATNGEYEIEATSCSGESYYTLKFKKPSDWTSAFIYGYGGSLEGDKLASWPGTAMTDEGDDWYSILVSDTVNTGNVILSDNGSDDKKLTDFYISTASGFSACYEKDASSATLILGVCPGETFYTLKFKKPSDWTSLFIYGYGGSLEGNKLGSWPGTAMTDEGDDWYSILLSDTVNTGNIIFNNNDAIQTGDYYIDNAAGFEACYEMNSSDNAIVSATCPELASALSKQPANDKVLCYPSTVDNTLHINVSGNIKIYSITGTLIKEFKNVTGGSTIDVSDLPQGINLVRLSMNDGNVSLIKIQKK
ncbi:MAG: starch-binding protein [Bacteroidales bacterium]|jgi:hypothetical protein|nr:starch-binding protein [Bacteroidales bacterium]